MDFQSEALKDFLESHTRLNNYIKISTVAVDYLYHSSDQGELSNLINDLILKSGERWTPRIIKDPTKELEGLKNDLVKSAIVWVYSAFDIYFKQTEGILSSHFKKANSNEDEIDVEKREHKVIELYQKLNWQTNRIDNILIVLKFYEALRHSVAHNLGNPNNKLIEISNSVDFLEAIKNWKTKFPERSISPPPIVSNEAIKMKPHHSILYSETCLRIARDINEKLFTKLGEKYFIDKSIKKHLIEAEKLTEPKCQNLIRYLVYHVKGDYNIEINPYSRILEHLSIEKVKDYKKRYKTLTNIR